jgi:hypothetical protein
MMEEQIIKLLRENSLGKQIIGFKNTISPIPK